MQLNIVNDLNDENYYVKPGEVSYSDNGIELSTGGLYSCRALIVTRGKQKLLCHIYANSNDKSKSVNPHDLAQIIKERFDPPINIYSAIGCKQNEEQRTDLIVEEVVRILDAKHICIGTVPDLHSVTTKLNITHSMRNPNLEDNRFSNINELHVIRPALKYPRHFYKNSLD